MLLHAGGSNLELSMRVMAQASDIHAQPALRTWHLDAGLNNPLVVWNWMAWSCMARDVQPWAHQTELSFGYQTRAYCLDFCGSCAVVALHHFWVAML